MKNVIIYILMLWVLIMIMETLFHLGIEMLILSIVVIMFGYVVEMYRIIRDKMGGY